MPSRRRPCPSVVPQQPADLAQQRQEPLSPSRPGRAPGWRGRRAGRTSGPAISDPPPRPRREARSSGRLSAWDRSSRNPSLDTYFWLREVSVTRNWRRSSCGLLGLSLNKAAEGLGSTAPGSLVHVRVTRHQLPHSGFEGRGWAATSGCCGPGGSPVSAGDRIDRGVVRLVVRPVEGAQRTLPGVGVGELPPHSRQVTVTISPARVKAAIVTRPDAWRRTRNGGTGPVKTRIDALELRDPAGCRDATSS